MINLTIKSGRLVAAPEVKKINEEKTMCRFRMAVWQGEDREPLWLNCAAWDRTAEAIAKLGKGDLLTICGRDVMEYWYDSKTGEKRSSWRVLVTSFEFGGGRKDDSTDTATMQETAYTGDTGNGREEDDLPF